MRYLHKYYTRTEYEETIKTYPDVSCIVDEDNFIIFNHVVPVIHDYSLDYLTFTILTSGTIKWNSIGSGQAKTIQYSLNDGAWTTITASSSTTINVVAGDKVRFKGSNTSYAKDKSNYSGFEGGTATFDIEGNIMSLIYGDNFENNNTLLGNYNFCSIFKKSNVISAENLVLPATSLTNYCYRAMFSLCSTLTIAPQLPATTLATGVYWYMFEGCNITTAPDLLATTLVNECYGNMFTKCSKLNYIKCLATSGFNTTNCLTGWVTDVSSTGTFVKDSNTTWTTGVNGIPTGWIVIDNKLVEDPVILFNGEDKITISCETSGANIYYRLNQSGNYLLYTGIITINSDTIIEAYAEKDNEQSDTVTESCTYVEHIYKFAGLQISKGPLYYGTNGYEIKDSWNYSSFDQYFGKTIGSTFFNFIEMGQLFEDTNFSSSSGDIENSLDPLNGWRLPTKDEWASIISTVRDGSTINGVNNKHYAMIELIDTTFAGNSTPRGILLFPDNENISGITLTYMDNSSINTGITISQLNNYLNQGCKFIPCNGYYHSNWEVGGSDGNYWSSIENNSERAYYLYFSHNYISSTDYTNKQYYYGVWLVKYSINGTQTILQVSNQSINSWEL